MSEKQQRRAQILARLESGGMTVGQAAALLGTSARQVRRLRERYAVEGLASVVHANTGRQPPNKTSAEVRAQLAELAGQQGRYHDFNTSHLQELLAEREGIQIGRSTLDRLLVQEGVRKRRRSRPRRVFGRRERCARAGEMLLTDGSQHDWLEGRDPAHPKMCLTGAIDDATSRVVHLRFWPTECQAGYILMARQVTVEYGVPMGFYHDGHTMLVSPKEPTIEDELAGREPMSQWQALLAGLGTQAIRALSPQAKGRIERLWGTLQDRLLKEMRLAGVCTLAQANAFLADSDFVARFNARFGLEARDPEPAWVPAPELDLPYYFATKQERTVRTDHTLSWMRQTLQIRRKRGERSLAGTRVMVHTTPEGQTYLYAGKQRLAYSVVAAHRPAAQPAAQPTAQPTPAQKQQKHQRPTRAKPTDSAGTRAWLYATT